MPRFQRRVIANAHDDLARAVRSGVEPSIDAYAATSTAELFAVATEWFFDRPADLRARMPELYELLRDFYDQQV